jgi:hypothetical protein
MSKQSNKEGSIAKTDKIGRNRLMKMIYQRGKSMEENEQIGELSQL